MRIGYMYDLQAYPPRGGNHRHVFELVNGFQVKGHEVHVVNDNSMPDVTNHKDDEDGITSFIKNIEILYVRIDARLTRKWKALTRSMTFAQNNNIPIVWEINAPSNETLAFSWLGGQTSDSVTRKESYFRRARRFLHALRKYPMIFFEENHRKSIARKVSLAICVSSALSLYAKKSLKIRDTLVLPNGGPLISLEEIKQRRARRKNSAFTVLYSGSAMYPWQGLNYLIPTIYLAEKLYPDIHFVLAVNQRTKLLPETNNVEILESLDREGILNAMCSADACIALHPEYFWSRYRFHGSPMKMFEYMGCMVPVIASNLGQMKDIVINYSDGVLCENEPEDILEKIVYLKNNRSEAENIARAGWERVQHELNWNTNVEKTILAFEKLLT